MKFIAFTIAAVIFLYSSACFAEKLAPEDFIGVWSGGAGVDGELDSLDIRPEGRAEFTRRFPSLNREKTASERLETAEAPDLLVIRFRDDKAVKYRLILSGWKRGQEKMLFGTIYTYDGDRLAGIAPVSFTPNP